MTKKSAAWLIVVGALLMATNTGQDNTKVATVNTSPMTAQLPTAVSIGAATSVQVSSLTPYSEFFFSCITATSTTYRCGAGPQTALSTDTEVPGCTAPTGVCMYRTLSPVDNTCAFFSTAGNTCKFSVLNKP